MNVDKLDDAPTMGDELGHVDSETQRLAKNLADVDTVGITLEMADTNVLGYAIELLE